MNGQYRRRYTGDVIIVAEVRRLSAVIWCGKWLNVGGITASVEFLQLVEIQKIQKLLFNNVRRGGWRSSLCDSLVSTKLATWRSNNRQSNWGLLDAFLRFVCKTAVPMMMGFFCHRLRNIFRLELRKLFLQARTTTTTKNRDALDYLYLFSRSFFFHFLSLRLSSASCRVYLHLLLGRTTG